MLEIGTAGPLQISADGFKLRFEKLEDELALGGLPLEKAVDFGAIGKAVAEIGTSLAVANEPWEGFCGTMRRVFLAGLYRAEREIAERLRVCGWL